jgi:hypothetical protein
MLWTVAIIFFLLWALGLLTSYTLGGYIHVLIVVAVAMLLIRILQGSTWAKSLTKKGNKGHGRIGP